MAAATNPASTANAMPADQGYQDDGAFGVDALHIEQRYGEERAKRLRPEGDAEFVDLDLSDEFKHFLEDPWVDPSRVKDASSMFANDRCEVLIIGAGFSGLMFAIRMVEAGIKPEDIRIIDPAGGWGGTWYWNRYPGLMCDIESYLYLPLLEETGYVPKHRYSYGHEILDYANLIAKKWGVDESAVFQTRAKKLVWDSNAKEWQVELVQQRTGGELHTLNIRAQFATLVNGVLNWPKLPGIPGILDFKGDVFHSSRFNYALTGGSPKEPSLTKLEGKKIAIVGTGATAVQLVPHIAKWAKHLYVIQRTPSTVDERDQRETDPDWFRRNVAFSAGWQRERLRNFHGHFSLDDKPSVNLVDDGWTHAETLVAQAGNINGPKAPEEIPAYIQRLHVLDLPRQERVRKRAENIVQDQETAKKLQAWYPTWCKRPCFHDDFLPTFNRSNVTLIDTDGKGADQITTNSIVVAGQSYSVDTIIFCTGFRAPFKNTPAERAGVSVTGQKGVSMSEVWANDGPMTQHGVLDQRFPNLFISGVWQAGISPNYLFTADTQAKHSAYILAEAKRRAGGKPFALTVTPQAAEEWAIQVVMRAAPMAAGMGCTPSYFNQQGELDRLPPEMQMKLARYGLWGHGIEDYIRVIEAWRAEGGMGGINISV